MTDQSEIGDSPRRPTATNQQIVTICLLYQMERTRQYPARNSGQRKKSMLIGGACRRMDHVVLLLRSPGKRAPALSFRTSQPSGMVDIRGH